MVHIYHKAVIFIILPALLSSAADEVIEKQELAPCNAGSGSACTAAAAAARAKPTFPPNQGVWEVMALRTTTPEPDDDVLVRPAAIVAELFAMAFFVFVGCGSAMVVANLPGCAWVLQVSAAFGFMITALVYSIAHWGGGHINCAVTFAMVVVGETSVVEGLLLFAAQMIGSVLGAILLLFVVPKHKDQTGTLGSNGLNAGWHIVNAFVGEVIMTFFLVYLVLETTQNNERTNLAAMEDKTPLAIGLAVFLAHSVLVPIDGCSINPTRSFGPALVAHARSDKVKSFAHMWIFWVGPLCGSAVASGVYVLQKRRLDLDNLFQPEASLLADALDALQ